MKSAVLPDEVEKTAISLKDVASNLAVSVASVRNWIKTGYLDQIQKGLVSQESFDAFKNNVAGGEKLTTRANKLLKDSHNHADLVKQYHSLINENKIDGYDLGLKYEQALSNSYRNKKGVYYTPATVVEHFFQYLPEDCSKLSFCDPCCGSGNFIIAAINHGISPENIYGYDIDPFAVALTKKRIYEKTGYQTNNILQTDFLECSLKPNPTQFDIIFTNPPWGKKIRKHQKQTFAKAVGAGKSLDTSSLFFFACLSRLANEGYLGFLLQEAFFNVACYEHARKKALALQVLSVIDFGKPFKGLLTKAKGIVLKNTAPKKANKVICSDIDSQHHRLQESFLLNPKAIFNSHCSPIESKTISHLYSLPHISLANQAKWGLGIVTGNNKKFIQNTPEKGYIAVYKGADISQGEINKADSFIPDDLSLYQQVAPIELYQAKEKLIYKFISSKLVFFCDEKQRHILNSANLLIPDKDFPISQFQLSAILNSGVMSWLFQAIFDTHKVLRSDLEALPVHCDYFTKHEKFDEQTFCEHLGIEQLDNGVYRVKK